MDKGSPSPRLRHWFSAALILILICAGAARIVPAWNLVFPAAHDTRMLGADSYYHLRHAQFAAENFPHLLRWDPGTFYPNGQVSDAAGVYDLTIAGIALVASGGHTNDDTVAVVAAIMPAALGVLSFLVLYLLGAHTLGRGPALIACALYLLYPGPSLSRTELGFADHHAAELLLSLWVITSLTRHVDRELGSGPRIWWKPAFWAPLPLALFMFTWKGGAAHFLITGIAILVYAGVLIGRGRDVTAAAVALFRYGFGLMILVGAPTYIWPELVLIPTIKGAVILGAAGLALGPAAYLLASDWLRRRGLSSPEIAIFGVSGIAAVGVVLVLITPDAPWLLGQMFDRKVASVMEHQAVTPGTYWHLYGGVGLTALIAAPWALYLAARGALATSTILPLVTGALLAAWWVWSHDYGYYPAPYLAYLTAILIAAWDRHLGSVAPTQRRWAGRVVIGLLAVLPLAPVDLGLQSPWADHARDEASPTVVNDGWIQAMIWMRTATPEPSVTPRTRVPPWPPGGLQYSPDSYGVLSAWDFGHLVSALGNRPPVWSGWPSGRTARWFLLENEPDTLKTLCPDCKQAERIRYVVLDGRTMGPHFIAKVKAAGLKTEPYNLADGLWVIDGKPVPHQTFGPKYARTIGVTLYEHNGDGLSHFRLVYDSPHESYLFYSAEPDGLYRRWRPIDTPEQKAQFRDEVDRSGPWRTKFGVAYDGVILPTVKIFEAVKGARLIGTTTPYAWVRAELNLKSATSGQTVKYSQTLVADEQGHFELTVPYGTTGQPDASVITAVGPYHLAVSVNRDGHFGSARRIAVPESAVRDGTAIRVAPIPNPS